MTDAKIAFTRARQIDALCDKFENDWKAGRHPQVEVFVEAIAEPERDAARSALLAIERELQERSVADTSVTGSSVVTSASQIDATALHTPAGEMPIEIGRFAIRGILGAGAFGQVYRALDPRLGREVAVKTPIASAPSSAHETARFLKEARAVATMNHPNICQIHEVGEHNARPYIVMPLIHGESLAETLKQRRQPLAARQIALIVRKLALALAAAHAKGIVHRDLKPANIMFDRERKDLLVMDFGLARGPQSGGAGATQSGIVMGTPAYMSPEQARGDSKEVGPAGDIYSLGVILYELLTGTRPYNGTATEVIGQILHVEPEAPSRRRAGVDPVLEAACLRAMAKDPAARFASMKEFAVAVDGALKAPTESTPAAAIDTARAKETHRESADGQGSANMSELFAVLSAERKTQQAATVAAVDAAVRRSRTPPWVFIVLGLLLAGGLSALAGIVFFTRSENVKVTIKLTDVDLADKTLSFFLDDEPISPEQLAKPVELKPGEHMLVVRRGKEVVKRMLLTVTGRPNPGITVEVITENPSAVVWRSLMPTPAYLAGAEASNHGTGDKVVKLTDGNLEMHGSGAAFRPDFAGGKNYIVRAKVLSFSGKNMIFRSRCQPGEPHYGAYFHEPRPGIDLPTCGLGKQAGGWQDLVGTMKAVADTLPVEFALSCFENKIAIYMNGELMVGCQDAAATEGKFHITLTQDSHVVLRDLEVCVLDGTKLTPDDVFPPNPDAEGRRALVPAFLTPELRKGNLLKNGDFEANGYDDWKFESWRNDRGVASLVDEPHSGKRALRLSFAATDSGGFTQKVAVKRHRNYLYSGWIKTKNLRFAERSRGGAQLYAMGGYRQRTDALPGGDNDWTYFAMVFRSGNRDSVEVQARLGEFAGTVTGTAWFDDLCLIELPDADDGFVSLFNGKDLTGWLFESGDQDKWKVQDGAITVDAPAVQGRRWSWLLTEKNYADFIVRWEFRCGEFANSGLGFRAVEGERPQAWTEHDRPTSIPVHLEINLWNQGRDPNGVWQTGTIMGSVNDSYALKPADITKQKPNGTWNDMEVELRGQQIKVRLNGSLILDRNLDDLAMQGSKYPGIKRTSGRLGFQRHTGLFQFRNIRIKELKPTDDGWVSLFNGKDLTGWKMPPGSPPNPWKVENGILTATTGTAPSMLLTDRGDYKDLHLRAEAKLESAIAGIKVRTQSNPSPFVPSYTLDLIGENLNREQRRLAMLKDASRVSDVYPPLDTWISVEILIRGFHVQVLADGKVIEEYDDPQRRRSAGHIGLARGPNTRISFRKIEIKELAPETVERSGAK